MNSILLKGDYRLLTTVIYLNNNNFNFDIEFNQISKENDDQYSILSKKEAKIGTIIREQSSIKFEYGKNLSMDDYEIIHNCIMHVHNLVGGRIDDSNSLLGYLENGEGAYIITNWEEWYAFLHKARYKTMEGQKVKVLDAGGDELGSGLLTDYKIDRDSDVSFVVNECTLITTSGEQTFYGDYLKIVPVNDWL